jgi:DNA modification methylase
MINKTMIENVSPELLIPYAKNSRTHTKDQIKQVANSIKEFGFTNPILVGKDNGVIAGHCRLLAAKQLGLKTVPVIRLDHLSPAQRKAYIIADNRLALNAGWDDNFLIEELKELQGLEFDLSLLGFNDKELNDLLATPINGLTDEDDVPEAPQEPEAKLGDIYILGNHRIMCGDSTVATDVERLLNGVKPHLMVTDPPYGVEYDADWRNKALRKDGTATDGRAVGKVLNDDRADWADAWALFPGNIAYIWHGSLQTDIVKNSIEKHGFKCRALIIWAKSHFAIGRGDYHGQHEPCWYAVKGKGNWTGDRKQTTVWNINKPQKSETGHSTQKPIECMRKPIENNSSVGQAIYEPFSGSGTTIIACEQTGRHCLAMELNPAYVDVAVKRWEQFTGNKAKKSEL